MRVVFNLGTPNQRTRTALVLAMTEKLPVGFRPMSTFNPEEPALLFDAVHDKTLPWPGGKEDAALWREQAATQSDGSVRFDGLTIGGCPPP